MNIVGGWRKFWFSDGSYFDLAIVRIMAVGLQCYVLLLAGPGAYDSLASLPSSLYHPIPILRVLMFPFVGADIVRPDTALLVQCYWITLLAGFAGLAGFATNLSLLVFAVGNIFLQSYSYSFQDYHHPDAIMMVALCALALAPCGRVLSMDSILNAQRHRANGVTVSLLDYKGSDATWAIKFIQCFFSLMYLSAVASKFIVSGLDWANGYTLQYYYVQDGTRWESSLGLWASQHHFLVFLSQWVVLLFQATYFLIIFFPKLRWFYLPVGLCFHIGIYLTLRAPFPEWMIFYAAYIPWTAAFKLFSNMRIKVPTISSPRVS